jgi:hypothetical protein
MSRHAIPVYAVIWVDLHTPVSDEGDQPTAGAGLSMGSQVKEFPSSLDEAEREVTRLNALNTDKGST